MNECRSQVLTLDFTKRPEEDGWECLSTGSNIPGIEATKETNQPVNGFTKYHYKHNSGGTFNLINNLGGGHVIPDIKNPVKYVEVYYWNSGDHIPILLGITRGNTNITKYYSYRSNNKKQSNWRSFDNSEKPLIQLLDEKNCSFYGAIPFDIKDPTEPSRVYSYKDTPHCISTTRKIEKYTSPTPPKPPESEYTVQEYTVRGRDTKISRVTYNGQDTIGITLPNNYAVSNIRVYSYPDFGGGNGVPLMLQFIKKDGTEESKWFESKNKDGTQWTFTTGSGFYVNDLPTEKLSDKLDEVVCSIGIGVTMNLTHGKHKSGEPYCCGRKHDGQPGPPTDGEVANTIPYYKHHVGGGTNLAGIKYNEGGVGGQRKNIKLNGQNFPLSNVTAVYAFYCTGNDPKLIYLDSTTGSSAKGWHKPSTTDDTWESVLGISEDPENIKDCKDDKNFEQLVDILSKFPGCNLGTCAEPTQPLPRQEATRGSQGDDSKEGLEGKGAIGPQPEAVGDTGVGTIDISSLARRFGEIVDSVDKSFGYAGNLLLNAADIMVKTLSTRNPVASAQVYKAKEAGGGLGAGEQVLQYPPKTENALSKSLQVPKGVIQSFEGTQLTSDGSSNLVVSTQGNRFTPGGVVTKGRNYGRYSQKGEYIHPQIVSCSGMPNGTPENGLSQYIIESHLVEYHEYSDSGNDMSNKTFSMSGQPQQDLPTEFVKKAALEEKKELDIDEVNPSEPPAPPAPQAVFAEAGFIGTIAGYFFAGSAGSGLTGFLGYKGYSLYKNFKGDPWVIHGYPMDYLVDAKNAPL